MQKFIRYWSWLIWNELKNKNLAKKINFQDIASSLKISFSSSKTKTNIVNKVNNEKTAWILGSLKTIRSSTIIEHKDKKNEIAGCTN